MESETLIYHFYDYKRHIDGDDYIYRFYVQDYFVHGSIDTLGELEPYAQKLMEYLEQREPGTAWFKEDDANLWLPSYITFIPEHYRNPLEISYLISPQYENMIIITDIAEFMRWISEVISPQLQKCRYKLPTLPDTNEILNFIQEGSN